MLDPATIDAMTEALDDEYKARATYRAVIEKFGTVRPFSNIVEAEGRHAKALMGLFGKYDLPVPEDCYAGKVESPPSIEEACRQAVQSEIDNAEMYDRLLDVVTAPDVREVLQNLQRASQENHLPAFRRRLERESGGGWGRGRRRQGS